MNRADELMSRARDQTGLAAFGEDSFHEGLERLTASLDTQARLNATGRLATDAQIVDLLMNRLKIEDWYARHPDIEDEEIGAPLVGLGLPRTGSTALACMLGEDLRTRSLRTWETVWPCPPPGAVDMREDTRLAQSTAAMAQRAQMFPRMTAMLPSTPTSPTECQMLMGLTFQSQIFQAYARIPDYVEWFNNAADMVTTYRYVRRVLKLLQWRMPKRNWRLKSPTHSMFIAAFDTVFPDALFVMTHRDVAHVIPSVADLYLELHTVFSDDVNMFRLGAETSEFCELSMRRLIAFRDGGANHRFFDIQFDAFQRDPYPSLQALYGFLGAELTPHVWANMQAWRRSTPPEARGYVRTNPAAFGLDTQTLRTRFAFYSKKFHVSVGAPRSTRKGQDDAATR